MTGPVREKDLRLGGEDGAVQSVEFSRNAFQLRLRRGGVELSAPFGIVWPDGSSDDFDPELPVGNPVAHRLLDTLLGASIVASVAGIESAYLRIRFDNGTELTYIPTFTPWEDWRVSSPDGTEFVALTNDELEWWGGPAADTSVPDGDRESRSAETREVGHEEHVGGSERSADDGATARAIDLELSDHVVEAVTLSSSATRLQTASGQLYFVGPFSLTTPGEGDSDGDVFVFDPRAMADDPGTGIVLDWLMDQTIATAVLRPDTSELHVTFADGLRLDWTAPGRLPGYFQARNKDYRQFWSRGDGTVCWLGGPEGTHPKFLAGGPRPSDSPTRRAT